jgi:multidrug resistance efflux pump
MAEDITITRREFEARLDSLQQAISAQKESVTIAMAAADRAVTKAETAVEKRFENSNEWRNTVETLQRTYLPRTEFDQGVKTLADKISVLNEGFKAREARGLGAVQTWAVIGMLVSMMANGVLIFIYLSGKH